MKHKRAGKRSLRPLKILDSALLLTFEKTENIIDKIIAEEQSGQ